MSLLNDVLRDLDKQDKAKLTGRAIPETLRVPHEEGGRWKKPLAWGFFILTVIAATLFAGLAWQKLVPTEAPNAANDNLPHITGTASGKDDEIGKDEEKIRDDVENQAIAAQRRITANATESDPAKVSAAQTSAGEDAVEEKMLQESSAQRSHAKPAEKISEPVRTKAETGVGASSNVAAEVAQASSSPKNNLKISLQKSSPQKNDRQENIPAKTNPPSVKTMDDSAGASIKPSADPVAVANRVLNQAKAQYQQGETLRAEQALRRLLATYPEHQAGQYQLASWLLARAGYTEALGLLASVDESGSPSLRALKAHALLGLGRRQQSLTLLEGNPPPVADHTQFHSLRAGLLQQAQRYEDAMLIYAELVEANPQRGEWWAGLGITLDQTGRKSPALRAYRQALVDPALSRQLTQYAEQRLAAIGNPSDPAE